jgi:hypothetical protein
MGISPVADLAALLGLGHGSGSHVTLVGMRQVLRKKPRKSDTQPNLDLRTPLGRVLPY